MTRTDSTMWGGTKTDGTGKITMGMEGTGGGSIGKDSIWTGSIRDTGIGKDTMRRGSAREGWIGEDSIGAVETRTVTIRGTTVTIRGTTTVTTIDYEGVTTRRGGQCLLKALEWRRCG
jgi:hypothetical protein